jgi:hypothetical protein
MMGWLYVAEVYDAAQQTMSDSRGPNVRRLRQDLESAPADIGQRMSSAPVPSTGARMPRLHGV